MNKKHWTDDLTSAEDWLEDSWPENKEIKKLIVIAIQKEAYQRGQKMGYLQAIKAIQDLDFFEQ